MDLNDADLGLWDGWSVDELMRRFAGVDASWYVAAGWAIDLFHGRQTRQHEDIEIGVPAEEFPTIRSALRDVDLLVVGDGRLWPVTDETLAAHRQTWVRDRSTGAWRLDVFRDHWEAEEWVLRRDPRVRVPRSQLVAHTASGIPYMSPEVVLLLKAKDVRPKDEHDFATALPQLVDEQREWLADALALTHAGHRWLSRLT